jgi:hemolysin activation/secretion protein
MLKQPLPRLIPLCLALLPGAAWSAGSAEDEMNQLRRIQPRTEASKGEFALPPVPETGIAPAERDRRPVRVQRIVFTGNRAISAEELARIAAPYQGKVVTVGELEELRQKISRHYVAQGYINSGALLDDDAYRDGILTYRIVEGRLGAIRLAGLDGLRESYVAGRLSDDPAAPLNIDRLRERFALLLNDPLFERMNARLSPGAQAGEALLDIEVQRARAYQLGAAWNNYRPPSIGERSLELSGWVRNLTGFGDVLEADLQNSTQDRSGSRLRLDWRLPLNTAGTHVAFKYEKGQSAVIEEPMRELDIESRIDSKTLGIGQILHESLRHKLGLGLDYQDRENRTRLLGEPFSFIPGEPDGVTRSTAWRFWQEYTYRTESRVLALRSTFVAARNNLDDLSGLPALAIVQPARDYRYWLGQAQFVQLLGDDGARLILRGTVQQSGRRLLPMDGLSIGGVNTVRGFRENQLIRDRGAVFNLEYEYPLIRNAAGLSATLSPFYDYGKGRSAGESADALESAGLATRVRWQGFTLDLAVAKRLRETKAAATGHGTLQDRNIHLQFGYSFF